jgi:hypothetical protein
MRAYEFVTEAKGPCWKGYRQLGMKKKNGKQVPNCVPESTFTELDLAIMEGGHELVHDLEETYHGNEFFEAYGILWYNEDRQLDEAEYQGRKVQLGKPMQGDVKKFKVYVKNPQGRIVKVNFGDPNMRIKKSNPERRRSFRARHNCDNPGPRHKARYWSCRKW